MDRLDFNEEILKTIKKDTNTKIVLVDNLNPKSDKYADIIINAIVGSNFNNKKFLDKNIDTKYFYGPKYLFLRDEFLTLKNQNKILRTKIENILLIFGGSDPANLTSKVLEKLYKNDEITLDVVIGPKYNHSIIDDISNKFTNENFNIHREPENIGEMMFNTDL